MSSLVPVLRIKAGFRWDVYAPAGFRILAALDGAAKNVVGADLELTAGTNDHTGGRHVLGEAFDVSVRGLTVQEILRLTRYLKQMLGERFTVLFECPTLPTDRDLASIAYVNGDATGQHLHIQVSKSVSIYPPEKPTAHG